MVYALFRFQDSCVFLSTRLSFSDITLNPLVNACVTLKIFPLKSGMYVVSIHFNSYNLPSLLYYNFQSPWSESVIVFLFLVLTTVFTSPRFVIYFQVVHHMWLRSWFSNKYLINFLADCFIFSHKCIISNKKKLVIIYIFSDIRLLIFFIFVIFLFFP